jgi:serine/threonine protein kinase
MSHKEGDVLGSGRYALKQILGEGSYGVVWLARDGTLQIDVAVKTLHPHKGKVADLMHEATTQARLNHPNVARIYTVDMDDQFIAMEYLPGESLEKHLKNHIKSATWVDMETAASWLRQCFDALLCAHGQSVIHGDIKPGNIMLDNGGAIKLTDFGVAKVISEERDRYTTNQARRLGSTTYMAPEVLRGERRDFASDIFSLGVLAYLLFTGRHPFYNTHPSGLFSVRESLLSNEEVTNPREFNAGILENHANILVKLLAKDRTRRYSTIKQAYEEFANIGLLCGRCNFKNPVKAKYCNQCGRSLDDVRQSQYKGKSSQELQSEALQLNGLGQYEEAIVFCDQALKVQPDNPFAHQTKGFALSSLDRYQEALASFEQALKHARTGTPSERTRAANIYVNMSYCYERMGDYPHAKEMLKKALECDPDHFKARELLERGQAKGYWSDS